MTHGSGFHDDEIVQVPVPRRLLPTVYKVLAAAMADNDVPERTTASMPVAAGSNMIELISAAAMGLDATRHPVSLGDLHRAYMSANPGIGKGSSRDSFDATVNYHCINMRSRFPDVRNRKKPAYWLTHPVFKRVARAQYMLLSADELARFNRCVKAELQVIYEDEYDVGSLPG
jgi:hypothetical protein